MSEEAAIQNKEPETVDDPQETASNQEPDTFTREYVEDLRKENAKYRDRSKRVAALDRALREAAVREATRDVLADPSDLAWNDDYLKEDGMPDAERIRQAAEDLTAVKPHLGRVRGDAGQGYRGAGSGTVDLAGILRSLA